MEHQEKRKPGELDLIREMLDDVFEHTSGDPLTAEKKILSVAFQLEACSDEGCSSIEGAVAKGCALILRDAAADAARLRQELLRLRAELETPSSEE